LPDPLISLAAEKLIEFIRAGVAPFDQREVATPSRASRKTTV
jgi:hypothetical protein